LTVTVAKPFAMLDFLTSHSSSV